MSLGYSLRDTSHENLLFINTNDKAKLLHSLVLTLTDDLTWIYMLYTLALLGIFLLILFLTHYFCHFKSTERTSPIRDIAFEQELEHLKQEEATTEETDETTSEDETPVHYTTPKKRYTVVLTPRKVHFAKDTQH